MALRSRVIWYEPVIDFYLNDPRGEVGRFLQSRSARFLTAAKAQAGVQTGALRSSISILEKNRRRNGQVWKLGSRIPYAYYHHEGTRPRVIEGRRKVLRFTSKGGVVFAARVRHPGTRPNKYLSDNLRIFF